MMRPIPTRAGSAGFTLIELLAVIVILSILAFFLLTSVFAAKEQVEVQNTKGFLTQIGAALSEYEQDAGDWAPSSFREDWGAAPNPFNVGGEVLYLTLCAEGAEGEGRFDEDPVNSDGDASVLRIAGHQSLGLWEIPDAWGNPIAYMHHRDYGREDVYSTWDGDTGELVQSTFKARRNAKTGRWHESRGFQLVSAGPNGVFDLPGAEFDDDITNFKH